MSKHEIMVLIAYVQKPPSNAHADISRKARGPHFSLCLHPHPLCTVAAKA